MNALRHVPLGQRIPDSPHSVCASLPTMQDIIGYEEKKPETMAALCQGYPRFVLHPYIHRLAQAHRSAPHHTVLPTASPRAARALLAFAGATTEGRIVEDQHFAWAHLPAHPEKERRAHAFLQHTGCGLSSRQAEDLLVKRGLLPAPFAEATDTAPAAQERVRTELATLLGAGSPGNLLLARSGMNAFHALFIATTAIQAARGRHLWVSLGWLYLDTQRILETMLPPGIQARRLPNVFDLGAIERLFEECGHRIAGIVTEAPTNPLLHTAHLEHLAALARKHNVLCLLDPTSTGPSNVHLLPHADALALSLTKYTAHAGDVLLGAAVLNPDSPFHHELRELLPPILEAPYERDTRRLAFEMRDWQEATAAMNANTMRLAELLQSHPRVTQVHWAYSAASREHYARIARGPERPGALLSFEMDRPIASFYDRMRAVKGPSFGVDFTLVCPFIYLAHYDLASTPQGRETLLRTGIHPELLRVSCGTEPWDEIADAFRETLDTL